MNRLQHQTTRALAEAEKEWLYSYGWKLTYSGHYIHPAAPDTRPDYSLRDAVAMTRADLLRYGSSIRSVG
jgi:hypothetical protein